MINHGKTSCPPCFALPRDPPAFLPRDMRSMSGTESPKSLCDFWGRSKAWGAVEALECQSAISSSIFAEASPIVRSVRSSSHWPFSCASRLSRPICLRVAGSDDGPATSDGLGEPPPPGGVSRRREGAVDKRHTMCISLSMARYQWDPAKNEWLLQHRGISFDQIVWRIAEGHLLDVLISDKPRYMGQKTIIPSRKLTRQYLRKGGAGDGTTESRGT